MPLMLPHSPSVAVMVKVLPVTLPLPKLPESLTNRMAQLSARTMAALSCASASPRSLLSTLACTNWPRVIVSVAGMKVVRGERAWPTS